MVIRFKSKHKSGSIEPKWQEIFTIGDTYELDTTNELPSIILNIFHKGAYSISEVPLGKVTVRLDTIDPRGLETDLWYPIEISGRMTEVSGELHLKMKFNRPPSNNLIEEEILDHYDDDEDDENSKLVPGRVKPNEVVVTVLQARGLLAMDKSLFSSTRSSDPMVYLLILLTKSLIDIISSNMICEHYDTCILRVYAGDNQN